MTLPISSIIGAEQVEADAFLTMQTMANLVQSRRESQGHDSYNAETGGWVGEWFTSFLVGFRSLEFTSPPS